MKRIRFMVFLVGTAFFWFGVAGTPNAATFLGKVATDGKVEIVGEGTNTLLHPSSTYPLIADSELITHEGRGLIKLSGGTVVTSPGSLVQALEEGDRVILFIKKGEILYRLSPYKANVSFRTLDGEAHPRKEGLIRASTDSLNAGRISVIDGKTMVEVDEGSLQVVTPKGATTVSAGQSLLLAQLIETPASVSVEELVGKTGSAETPLNPEGRVQIEGNSWESVVVDDNLQPIDKASLPEGTELKVVGVRGSTLLVQPVDRSLIAAFLPSEASNFLPALPAVGGMGGAATATIVANTIEGGKEGGEEPSPFVPEEEEQQ